MSEQTKTERRFGSFWKCLSCEGSPDFEHSDMMKHLTDAHKIDVHNTKGTSMTIMHMDGDTWFSWDYEWQIEDVKAAQHTCYERSPEDAAMWL